VDFSVFINGEVIGGAAVRASGCSGKTVIPSYLDTEFLPASFFVATGNFYLRRFRA